MHRVKAIPCRKVARALMLSLVTKACNSRECARMARPAEKAEPRIAADANIC